MQTVTPWLMLAHVGSSAPQSAHHLQLSSAFRTRLYALISSHLGSMVDVVDAGFSAFRLDVMAFWKTAIHESKSECDCRQTKL